MPAATRRRETGVMLAIFSAVLAWSSWQPFDRFTWWLEVAPALVGLVVLLATGRRFPLTRLAYGLLLAHAVILMVGGHYTYARVPLFDMLAEYFGFARNHYDRLGHLAQGFIPALVTRELLLRLTPLHRGAWTFAIVTCVALAISAFYELIEMWVALTTGTAAEAFLGTQGDVWDTQWDMTLALCGAIVAQLLLARVHDRALSMMEDRHSC